MRKELAALVAALALVMTGCGTESLTSQQLIDKVDAALQEEVPGTDFHAIACEPVPEVEAGAESDCILTNTDYVNVPVQLVFNDDGTFDWKELDWEDFG